MSKHEPMIQKYMTTQPEVISEDATLLEADNLMREKNIHHLPVLKDDKLTGIISSRDIKTALNIVGSTASKLKVSHVEKEHPYAVSPDTLLHEVVAEMAEKHYGCTLIVQHDKVVGIFTMIDACRALEDILEKRFHS
jgi:CBS domain-containing protein